MIANLRKWIAGLLFGLALAGTAQATVYPVGDLTGTSYVNAFSFATGANISDDFVFTLSTPSSFSSILSSITLANFFGISGFMLSLYDPSSALIGMFAPVMTPNGLLIDTGTLNLLAGVGYTAHVDGVVSGIAGGGYTVLMAAVPVPEPTEWMMFLAGLTLIGFMVRRRSRFN